MPFHLESTPSTQTFLKEHLQAEPNLKHLEYAMAEVQTQGIGRMSRSWVSERGNLFISIWIRDYGIPLTWVPHWVGVCLIEALRELGVSTEVLRLKWPNDLVFQSVRKLAGILCEKVNEGVVAGIGVNLLSAPDLNDRSTASVCEIAPDLSAQNLNLKVAEKLISKLRNEPDLDQLRLIYTQFSLLQTGTPIHWLDLHSEAKGQGTFVRYGFHGELVVRTHDGEEKSLYSEEIKLVL